MLLETNNFYEFGEFRLDLAEKVLLRDGKFIPITPKVFETLLVLVENAGRVIEKDELMQKIWQDRFVEESNLTFNIKMLRKALGDDAAKPTFIETVPRRGYRFIAEVKRIADTAPLPVGDYRIHSTNGHTNDEHTTNGHSTNGHSLKSNGDSTDLNSANSSLAKTATVTRPRIFFYLSFAAILIAVCAVAGFFLTKRSPTFYERFGSVNNNSGILSVEKLSDTGNVSALNISPDGKLLVYNKNENGKNTIWLRQFTSGKSVPLLAANDESIHGTGFSRDGEYVFYTHQRKGEPLALSRVSTFGGAPTRIIGGLHSGWTFSPDQKQIAFGRNDEQGTRLMIADADGRNERQVFLSPKSRPIFGISWAPDGKSIAYCTGSGRFGGSESNFAIYDYNLEDATEKPVTDFKWSSVDNIKWLPDRSGLLVTAREKPEGVEQIWRVSMTDRQVAPLTSDTTALSIRGASADFTRILASQTTLATNIQVAPTNDLSNARTISGAVFDVAWTRDGKIISPTRDSIKTDVWLANADGSDKRQMTVSDSIERSPEASPDGRFVVYVSTQNGRQNIWRMDADGGNLTPLTNGEGEIFPVFTPDSRWVVYISNKDKSLWRVPVEGGEPQQLSAERHRRVTISPDGTRLAHIRRVDDKTKLLIESFPECAPVQQFDTNVINDASFMRVVWSEDGKSITYFFNDAAFVGNLWRQSLGGDEPQKLTNFTSERILDFAFSPDESQIALVRGDWNFDAVILKGFK